MRNRLAVLALSSCLALTGCTSSLRIRSAPLNLKNPKGLPFYAKVGACKQQTVWLEARYEISAPDAGVVVINQETYDRIRTDLPHVSSVSDFSQMILKDKVEPIAPFISDTHDAAFDKQIEAHNLVLGANTGELTAIVDYANPMWLNSGRPLTGTTQVSGKFGPDGTLTEASAQVNDQTLSTTLTAVASIAGSAMKGAVADPKPFQITIKTTVRAHTHTRLALMNAGPDTSPTLPTALTNCSASATPIRDGSWIITDAAAPAKPADDTKKPDAATPADPKKP